MRVMGPWESRIKFWCFKRIEIEIRRFVLKEALPLVASDQWRHTIGHCHRDKQNTHKSSKKKRERIKFLERIILRRREHELTQRRLMYLYGVEAQCRLRSQKDLNPLSSEFCSEDLILPKAPCFSPFPLTFMLFSSLVLLAPDPGRVSGT